MGPHTIDDRELHAFPHPRGEEKGTYDIIPVQRAGVQAEILRERTRGTLFRSVALGVFAKLERGGEGEGAGVAGEAEEGEEGFGEHFRWGWGKE